MSKLIAVLICTIYIGRLMAQTNTQTVIMRRSIALVNADKSDDGIVIALVKLPSFSNLTIKEKTIGVLHKSYINTKEGIDSAIGWGKCYLIKKENYYFGIKLTDTIRPHNNDLLTFKADVPICYNGLLFAMSNNDIQFTTIYEKEFYNIEAPYLLQTATEEQQYFTHMVNDIHYTATEMLKQMPEANKPLKDGLYKDVPLFVAMQKTTINDLKEFLKYIKERPKKYAGQTWKISEVYATWLFEASPRVMD